MVGGGQNKLAIGQSGEFIPDEKSENVGPFLISDREVVDMKLNMQQHGSWMLSPVNPPHKKNHCVAQPIGSLGLGDFIVFVVKQEFVVCSQRHALASTLPKTPGGERSKGASNPHTGEEQSRQISCGGNPEMPPRKKRMSLQARKQTPSFNLSGL